MKFAICNELFDGWAFDRVCATAKELGYDGVEVAPFTLGANALEISAEDRKRARDAAQSTGIEIVGLHWLLAKTEGYHIGDTNKAVRDRTAEYLIELTKLCSDLGGKVMVFGSPAQRSIGPNNIRFQVWEDSIATFRSVVPALEEHGVTLCLEPLGPEETDFVNSAAEARIIVEEIGSPNFRLLLDVKAMSTEPTDIPDIIRSNGDILAHFHANDANRRGPGMGITDFQPISCALKEVGYNGWVSVEVFDSSPDPITVASESIDYLKKVFA